MGWATLIFGILYGRKTMAEPSGVKRDIEEQEGEAAKRARFSGEGEGEDPHVSAAPVRAFRCAQAR